MVWKIVEGVWEWDMVNRIFLLFCNRWVVKS